MPCLVNLYPCPTWLLFDCGQLVDSLLTVESTAIACNTSDFLSIEVYYTNFCPRSKSQNKGCMPISSDETGILMDTDLPWSCPSAAIAPVYCPCLCCMR